MKYSNSFTIILLCTVSVLFCISAIPLVGRTAEIWSIVAACALLLAISLTLLALNGNYGKCHSTLIPAIYLMLATANPNALCFSKLHAATLLMTISIFLTRKYIVDGQKNPDAFAASFFLGSASCLFPPAAWIFLINITLRLSRSEDSKRMAISSIFGLLMPLAIACGVIYIKDGAPQIVEFCSSLAQGMIDIGPKAIFYSPATIIRMVVILILTIIAAARVPKSITLLYAVAIVVIAGLFFHSSSEPFCLLTCMPAALILNEYVADESRRNTGIVILIAILILVAERVSYFI